jgi:hypothetical protein
MLTSDQHRVIEQAEGQPVQVVDPETKVTYYLVRADLLREIEAMSRLLEEQRQRAAIARQAKRNAEGRINEP